MGLNKAELAGMEAIAHNARFGWAALTGRRSPRRVARRLVERGLARSAGLVVVVDGDGFALEPERFREGFEFTTYGELVHAKLDAEEQVRWRARFEAEGAAA